MIFWYLLTSIGNTVITIPITLTIAIWLVVGREWKMAVFWCALFGIAMTLVLASKIAFIGWGIGIESLDFTGVSGHATRAAMVFPVLFYYGFQRAPRKITHLGVYLGVMLAVVIAISRVMVNAHSGSEILAGWLLGSGMSFIYLLAARDHIVLISRRWLLGCSFFLLFTSPVMKPISTDDMITSLALKISGHTKPFQRANWGHNHEMHFW